MASFALVLGVERAYWRQGVGLRLMQEIKSRAQKNGAKRLELTVRSVQ